MATPLAERIQSMEDGLQNVASGLGTSIDKSSHNRWVNTYRNNDYDQLTARFREDWVAQKVCTILPQDMTREWREISTPEGKQADLDFNVRKLCRDGYQWARVYGTSAIILDLKNAGPADKPLNLERLRPNCIRSLQIVDRTRLFPIGEVVLDPMDPMYGNPTHYQLGGSAERIHYTRILRFEATELPRYEAWKNSWYSDSTLIPLLNPIDNYHTAAQAAASLVHEANIDVVTIEGLQSLLTSDEGEAQVMKRFRIMKQLKSNHNILLLDSTEEFNTKTIALNGVKDLIWEYLRILAAAAGIPATRFLSASPDGMNATGESDLNNYIDVVKGLQTGILNPRLEILDQIIQAHYGIAPYEFQWNCIFPESATQKALRIESEVSAVKDLVDSRIITPQDAQKVLRDNRTFGQMEFSAPPPPIKPTTSETNNAKS